MRREYWSQLSRASTALVENVVANSELLRDVAVRDAVLLSRDAKEAFASTRNELRELGATFRSSPRYLRIVTAVAKIVARHRIASAAAPRRREAAFERAHRQSACELREICVELGGGVLKIGQLLSSRADLLPQAYIAELRELQDSAPALGFSEIAPLIEAELGSPCDSLFESVDDVATAAASIAQVHAATLRDGRDVVIKVQRPGVEELVLADLRAIELLANVFADSLPGVDLATTAAELARFLTEELDFRLEAARLAEFSELDRSDTRWHAPEAIDGLSARRVMVMERVRGRSLNAYLEDSSEAERARIISLLIELLAAQILKHGLAHGDPHPGNILISDDGTLHWVDFGCVLTLTPTERAAYVSLVAAILGRSPEAIAGSLSAAGFSAAEPEALVSLARLFLEAFQPGQLSELDPAQMIDETLRLGRVAGAVTVPPSFVLIGRIFGLVGGVVLHYRPSIDLFALLTRALA